MKTITCMCEHKFEAEIPESVDLEKTPDARQAILDGTFMNVTCPSCRKVLKPEFPAKIFHKGEGWEIDFVPELERRQRIKNSSPSTVRGKTQARLVIGYSELLEKVKIFEEKMDDRVVEYLKYIILSKVLEKTEADEADIDVYFHEVKGDDLIFHIQGLKSDEVGLFKIPQITYTKALSEIEKRLQEEPYSEFLRPPYVSLNKLYSWDDL